MFPSENSCLQLENVSNLCFQVNFYQIKPPPAETQSDQEDDEDVPPAVRKFLKGAKPHKSCPAQPRDSVPEQRKLDRKPGGGLGK